MVESFEINPYASPNAESAVVPDAEREIRAVIRVFRWIGWIVAGLYVPMTLVVIGALIFSLFSESLDSPSELAVALGVNLTVASVGIAFLRAASLLARVDPAGRKWARTLCCLLLFGFPLFTAVGAICWHKLNRHYAAYCELARQRT